MIDIIRFFGDSVHAPSQYSDLKPQNILEIQMVSFLKGENGLLEQN